MFCKWCGNTIKTTDKKCSSCGRETPPLSDCGGFYDLKRPWEGAPLPQDSSAAPAFAEGSNGPDPEVMRLREENRAIRKEANDRHKIMLIICGALGAALLVVLILYIVALTGDDPAPQMVPQGGGQAISTEGPTGTADPIGTNDPSATADDGATEPSEPKTTKINVLLRCDDNDVLDAADDRVSVSSVAEEAEDGPGVNVMIDLSEKQAPAEPATPEQGDEEPANTPAQPEAGTENQEDAAGTENQEDANKNKIYIPIRWKVNADTAAAEPGQLYEAHIALLSCVPGAETGFTEANFENGTVTWEWYTDGAFTVIDDGDDDARKLTLTSLDLPEEETGFGLRCHIVVTNDAGEVLDINIDGFQIEKNSNVYAVSYQKTEPTEA